jgi:hypothetical protein
VRAANDELAQKHGKILDICIKFQKKSQDHEGCSGKQCYVVHVGLWFEPSRWQIIFATFRWGASGWA